MNDGSLVVCRGSPSHSVLDRLSLRTIPGRVLSVFTMEDTVKYSWLLRASTSTSAPGRVATVALLRRVVLTSGVELSWSLLVCDVMDL